MATAADHPFLATASFPCVDLSVAGQRKGLDGEHSSAFYGFAEAIRRLGDRRPHIVMLENVVGFYTSKKGRDFAAVAKTLADLGYYLDAFVLDAKWFVPQSRPRVFVIGVLGGVEQPRDLWDDFMAVGDPEIRPRRLVDLMRSIDLPTGWRAFHVPTPNVERQSLADVIDLDDDQEWWDNDLVNKHLGSMSELHINKVSGLIIDSFAPVRKTIVGTMYQRTRNGKVMSEPRFDGLAGCLRATNGGASKQSVVVIHDGKIRMKWMTPREYARLQGADDFPLASSHIANRKAFGDAVCVPVIRWIDDHVLTPVHASIVEDGIAQMAA